MSDALKDARRKAHIEGIATTLRAFHSEKLKGKESNAVAAEIFAAMRERLEATDSPLSIAEVGLAAEVIMGRLSAGAPARAEETQIERLRRENPGFDDFSAQRRIDLAREDDARQVVGPRPLPLRIQAILAKPEGERTSMERLKLQEFEKGHGEPLSESVAKPLAAKPPEGYIRDPLARLKALRGAETIAKLKAELAQLRAVAENKAKDLNSRSKAEAQAQRVADALVKVGGKPEVEG